MNYSAIIQDAIACAGRRKALPGVSGCYVITNKVTGRVYVGQSANIRKRASHHMSCLRNGEHCSAVMQRDYAEHGEQSFSFAVAIQCDETERREVERELIKTAVNWDIYNTSVFDPMAGLERQNVWLLKSHMAELRVMSSNTGVDIVKLIRRAMAEFLERNK
jgi:group I intron endonuclease